MTWICDCINCYLTAERGAVSESTLRLTFPSTISNEQTQAFTELQYLFAFSVYNTVIALKW